MGAYSVLETDEYTGGIVFSKDKRSATRIGANLYAHGEPEYIETTRRKDLDKYELTGVPAWLLVSQGWHFECHGCGRRIDCDALYDDGMSYTNVVGLESGAVYCCHACRMESLADKAAINAYGEAFLEMLRDLVRARFPKTEWNFGSHKHHVFARKYEDRIVVVQARVSFEFPGMKFGPAWLDYYHKGQHGSDIIGPVRPEVMCCRGDQEAFEAYAAKLKDTCS